MQTIQDIVISNGKALYYRITEPLLLSLCRKVYSSRYRRRANPLISVYIPTYNRVDLLLERSVPSVLNQTYKNFELLIVGDHCTDDTEKRVSAIKDKRIRFYNLPFRTYRYPPTIENHWLAGPVVAANKALILVKGDWIARIDDDDIWTTDHLQKLFKYAQYGDFEFVSAKNAERRFGKNAVIDGIPATSQYFLQTHGDDSGPKIGATSTWLYRSYLKFMKYNIHCWRKKWNRVNDIDLVTRMYQAGVRMGFVESVLVKVLPRPGEKTVGLEAYMSSRKDKLRHFAFR